MNLKPKFAHASVLLNDLTKDVVELPEFIPSCQVDKCGGVSDWLVCCSEGVIARCDVHGSDPLWDTPSREKPLWCRLSDIHADKIVNARFLVRDCNERTPAVEFVFKRLQLPNEGPDILAKATAILAGLKDEGLIRKAGR